MRSALAAKQIWVAVITIWGTLDSLPRQAYDKQLLNMWFNCWTRESAVEHMLISWVEYHITIEINPLLGVIYGPYLGFVSWSDTYLNTKIWREDTEVKGTVSLISNHPSYKVGNARFTTVTLKALSDQLWIRWNSHSLINFNLGFRTKVTCAILYCNQRIRIIKTKHI